MLPACTCTLPAHVYCLHMYVICTCISPARVCCMHMCVCPLGALPSCAYKGACKLVGDSQFGWGLTNWLGTHNLVGDSQFGWALTNWLGTVKSSCGMQAAVTGAEPVAADPWGSCIPQLPPYLQDLRFVPSPSIHLLLHQVFTTRAWLICRLSTTW